MSYTKMMASTEVIHNISDILQCHQSILDIDTFLTHADEKTVDLIKLELTLAQGDPEYHDPNTGKLVLSDIDPEREINKTPGYNEALRQAIETLYRDACPALW